MAFGQKQKSTATPGRIQKKGSVKSHQKDPRHRHRQLHMQSMIFSLSPLALKSIIVGVEEKEPLEYEAEPLEDVQEQLLEDEADFEIVDEDDDPEEVEPYSDLSEYSILLDQEIGANSSPEFSLGSKYALTMTPVQGDRYSCNFEPPAWFHKGQRSYWRRYHRKKKEQQLANKKEPPLDHWDYINKLEKFLSACAAWLEEHKQPFLRQPSPETYVDGKKDFWNDPVILQDGVLARINDRLAENYRLDKALFSRLLDNIWLVWPLWNIPMKALFSSEFQRAWLIDRGSEIYRHTPDWPRRIVYPDFGKIDLDNAKKVAEANQFYNLDPEQKLRVLCNKVGSDMKNIFPKIVTRLEIK